MQVGPDDEVYEVDEVWLGPPKVTFPWRARYRAYGLGLLVFIVLLAGERRLGVPFGFFPIAFTLLGTIVITRLVGRRVNTDRPLSHFIRSCWAEITTPRRRTTPVGGVLGQRAVPVRPSRPRTDDQESSR